MSGAPKFDGAKSPIGLVAPDFIRAVADVLAFGAKKYDAWSWTKGKEWSRDRDAAMRHLLAWSDGEELDPESGLSHLAHAACDIMFLIVSQARGFGTDDRKKFEHPQVTKAREAKASPLPSTPLDLESASYTDARVDKYNAYKDGRL